MARHVPTVEKQTTSLQPADRVNQRETPTTPQEAEAEVQAVATQEAEEPEEAEDK